MRLCSGEQMRSIDSRAIAEYGTPSMLLMENAGRAVADRALARLETMGRRCPAVRVLCGRGNNGGDGFVAARHLFNRGIRVECSVAGDPAATKGDARVNLELLEKLGVPVLTFVEGPEARLEADLLIDALLGTGFRGEPHGAVGDAIHAINHSGIPTLAVDIPSGLDADTGHAASACVRAAETVTFGLPKVGLATYPGREMAGELWIAHISLPLPLLREETLRTRWSDPREMSALWPTRGAMAHKGDSGRLFVLAGSAGMTGAAVMACDSALRGGAGLVTLGIPQSLLELAAGQLLEAMTLPLPETPSRAHSPVSLATVRERADAAGALAIGPGFGRDPRSGELLRSLLPDCPTPMVVDADALTLLSPADGHTFPAHCVITPHPGEMARLLGTEIEEVQSNRLETARRAAARFGCVVLLKGPATVIASPDGRLAVNSTGGPALATGGTGDVLTGLVGACLARCLDPFDAATGAAYVHGLAGEIAGQRYGAPGAVAGDVIRAIPEALHRLQSGEIAPPWRIM